MAPINRRPGGWVVPGYKYLGPFNQLDAGEPVNKSDQAAQKHDFAYDQYIKSGKNPYLYFNKADQDFIEDLESDRSFGGWIGKTVFGIKRAIAPSLGEPDEKRARLERAQKRKLYFARSNRDYSKKSKMSSADAADTNNEAGEGTSSDASRAGAQNQGGGGGGAGGRGVGVSTGGWKGGTIFSDSVVVTRITRQWYAPIYDGHRYKSFGAKQENTNANSYWMGIVTPWGYFDFNCYAGHFSPQDWQRLTNEYKKWRPKAMRVKLYNLQIKQVVTLGADTLYNNDLTAGVHIFCDGSHQYPYPQNPWNEGVIPELPNDVWKLPQYGYYQRDWLVTQNIPSQGDDVAAKECRVNAPLFMLENSSHEVLRTGEETEFNFEFNCGWVMNDRAYAPPQQDYNAKIGTRRWYGVYDSSNSRYNYPCTLRYYHCFIFMPGPGTRNTGKIQTANDPVKSRGPFMTVHLPASMPINTGNSLSHTNNVAKPSDAQREKLSYQTAPANGACNATDRIGLAFDMGPHNGTDNEVTTRGVDNDCSRWNSVYSATGNTISEHNTVWMNPNQFWNSTPICRGNLIWAKAPRTNRRTMEDSSDGTLVMDHPPGTIFVKTQKIPIPTAANSDTYLNLYVTGQITCEIEWEVERYQTKNWRPELRNVPYSNDPSAYNFDGNGDYNMPTSYYAHMPTRLGLNTVL
ncbi:VP1/VP2 [Rhinolophus pusillus bocaparvovirus 2]|uniref:VP1/VP2 n=1 Tax=Rhinolophus pusillus bocaparvovirus 2 TaxID=2053080 RepID=UPI000CA3890B|nr:VP1/VP2 [Rhinolophus pusillus bocaparvovirus 2]ATV81493.1 VP1/VP2 [Rhinolophus pusillus bocaparvovirus 2]